MKQVFEPDPGEEQQREEANILMLRVGLALIDDARHAGGFEVDEAKLERRVAELWGSLASGDLIGKQVPVTVTPIDAERLQLSVLLDQNHSDGAVLRRDGVLLEEYASFGVSAEFDTAELSPQEQEQLRAAQEEHEALMRRSQFHGRHFLRTLSVDPQPESEVQILAVELFERRNHCPLHP